MLKAYILIFLEQIFNKYLCVDSGNNKEFTHLGIHQVSEISLISFDLKHMQLQYVFKN